MSTRTLKAAMLVMIAAGALCAQSTRLGSSCDLSVLGAKETTGFLTFDKELRDALSRQDTGMLALLVRYPLRINDEGNDRGSWYVHDSPSLRARFADIFPAEVRAAVLKQRLETVNCSNRGIMYYGEGSVWVNRQTDSAGSRYLVETINLPGYDGSRYLGPHPHVQFVCETSKHRVIVDSVPDAGLRYRAWNNPNSLTGKPDFEIAKGTVQSEGTGPCRHSIWTFATGPTGYSVQELGCYTDAPAGAKGRLEVSTSGTTQASWWCF